MTPEERFTRIETHMDRLEVWLEKALREHELRARKLEGMQVFLMDSKNDTWKALKSLSDNVEKLIRFRGPNGQQG